MSLRLTSLPLFLIPLTLGCSLVGIGSPSAKPQVYYRSAIIVKRASIVGRAGIVRLDFTSYGTNVTHVVLDTTTIVESRNTKNLPLIIFAKITQPVDTLGYVYAKRTPTWVAKVIQVAADSTGRYAILAPSSALVQKGSYVRVRE